MSARAVVKLTVEVSMDECWGGDWKLDDLFKSASDSAVNLMCSRFREWDRVRIIGAPEVTAIIAESKK